MLFHKQIDLHLSIWNFSLLFEYFLIEIWNFTSLFEFLFGFLEYEDEEDAH